METLLEIRDLSVTFQDVEGTRAARHVNLQLKKGELAALVGESGSGKTVLCKTILQLLGKKTRVESGQILYRDSNILEYTEKQMQKFRGKEISMVFQDPYLSLNPTISIGKQIMETILLHEKISKTVFPVSPPVFRGDAAEGGHRHSPCLQSGPFAGGRAYHCAGRGYSAADYGAFGKDKKRDRSCHFIHHP